MRILFAIIFLALSGQAFAKEYAYYFDKCTGLTGEEARQCEADNIIVDGLKICKYRAFLSKDSKPMATIRIPEEKGCPTVVELKRVGNTIVPINPYDKK